MSIVLIVAIRLNFITNPGVLPPRIEIVSHYQSSLHGLHALTAGDLQTCSVVRSRVENLGLRWRQLPATIYTITRRVSL